jgi:hypothetical protein
VDDYSVINWGEFLAYLRKLKQLEAKGELSSDYQQPNISQTDGGLWSMSIRYSSGLNELSLRFGEVSYYEANSVMVRRDTALLFRGILLSVIEQILHGRSPNNNEIADLNKLVNAQISHREKATLALWLHSILQRGFFHPSARYLDPELPLGKRLFDLAKDGIKLNSGPKLRRDDFDKTLLGMLPQTITGNVPGTLVLSIPRESRIVIHRSIASTNTCRLNFGVLSIGVIEVAR